MNPDEPPTYSISLRLKVTPRGAWDGTDFTFPGFIRHLMANRGMYRVLEDHDTTLVRFDCDPDEGPNPWEETCKPG